MDWFIDLVRKTLESEVATGMTAGALLLGAITFVAYQLRSLPGKMVALGERQFTVTLTVYGDDQVYHPLSVWLSNHPATKRSRKLNVVTKWDDTGQGSTHMLTPGPGVHLLRFQNRWFLIRKEVTQPGGGDSSNGRGPASGGYSRKSETLTITTTGRDPSIIQKLIDDVTSAERGKDTLPVYFWAGRGYARCAERLKRPLSTVYLDDGLKQRVIDDLKTFLARRRWYADRGIPWRRGYLFEGPPGTGKSTFIFALASLLEKPVYIVNPSTIWDDGSLMQAMNEAGSGIVVIEDADTFKVTQERAAKRSHGFGGDTLTSSSFAAPSREEESMGITLSGLLNAIDGIASAEGRILFITSNHPDALDAALMRPGRIDVRERLGLAHKDVARQMFAAYFPEGDAEAFAHDLAPRLPMSPAAIQNLLLGHENTPAPHLKLVTSKAP